MANPVIVQTAPQWSAAGVSVDTLDIIPVNQGDLLAVAFFANGGPATAVTGGGVTSWTCASSYYDTSGSVYAGLWYGVVATTGLATITVTDAGLGTNSGKLWCREFMAIGASWQPGAASPAPGTTGAGPTGTGSFTIDYPMLGSPAGGNALYVGAAFSYFGDMTQGSDAGFLWAHPGADGPEMMAYNPSVTGTVAPTATSTSNFNYISVAAMFTAGGGANTNPAYAGAASILSGGSGTWSNPGNAVGAPSGSYATWTSP